MRRMRMPIEWLPAQGAPEQLILLLHGWDGDAKAMATRPRPPAAAAAPD